MWTQSTSVTDGQTDGLTDGQNYDHKDRATVQRIASHGKNVYVFSIGTKIDDLEWPLSEIQGHWFLKCRKNGEIQLSNDSDAMYYRVAGYIICIRPTYSCTGALTYLLTYLHSWLGAHIISETVKDRAEVTINFLTAYIKSYTGFLLPPNCMI